MKRKLSFLLAAMMILAVLSACGGGGTTTTTAGDATTAAAAGTSAATTAAAATTVPANDSNMADNQVLVVRLAGDPMTFQPNTIGDDFAYGPVQNIYNRLVKLDASKQIIPDLARTWETSADGLHITFHLAENVVWHDGTPFTSADVKYTFDTIRTTSEYFASFYMENVASIDCPDDNTVIFNMSEPDVAVIGYLGWYGTFILPQHLFDNGQGWDDNPVSEKPIGTGPFKFEKYTPTVSIELVKNENYWDCDVILDKVIYQLIPDDATSVQALRTGEIDMMEGAPVSEGEALKAEGFNVEVNVYPSPYYFYFNWRNGKETPDAVRQAIALCINREDINAKVFGNVREPEYNFYPSVVEWASSDAAKAPDYNIEAAIQVLEDAGLTKDANGFYYSLQVECYSVDGAPDVCTLISAECKKAGINLTVNAQEYLAWNNTVDRYSGPGTFDMSMSGGFQGPDPAALSNRVGTDGASNGGYYSNPEIDALFKEALTNSDQAYRQERYFKIQEMLRDDLAIIPIISYAGYDVSGGNIVNTPLQCVGITGWAEYSRTYIGK